MVSKERYYADEMGISVPTLSSGIARLLCDASPAHAREAHPKLNPNYRPREDERFDLGTVVHAILLEGQAAIEVVDAEDWRTKEAREQRDTARAAGKVPLLAARMADVQGIIVAVREQLDRHRAVPPLFTAGEPERILLWHEPGGVACRARLDWLRDDRLAIDDLKTTTRSAKPDAYARNLFATGADVQAAFYIRGVQELYEVTPTWRWVVVETSPPYALSVITPGEDMLALARKKVDYALEVWRRCLATDTWPGYRPDVATAELPAWEEARWLDREAAE